MPASELIDVETSNRYITKKVFTVRLSTRGAAPPNFSRSRPGVLFAAFLSVNVDKVIDTVQQLPDESSADVSRGAGLDTSDVSTYRPTSRLASRRRSSHPASSRKLAWIHLTLVHIDRSRTSQFYSSFLNPSMSAS